MDVIETMNNDGAIAAHGVQVNHSAGASGGSVYVTAGTASGTGYFGARGANGWMNYEGGGGGGGRIAIVADVFTGTYSYNVNGGVRASSAGGGNGSAGTVYESDRGPDFIDISSSPASPFSADSVTISTTAYDMNNLSSITIYLDSTDLAAPQNTCTPGGVDTATCDLVVGTLDPGEHIIYVEAEDSNFESSVASATFWVFDELSPVIEELVAIPATPNWIDDVTLSATASDADGIDAIDLYLGSTDPGNLRGGCAPAGGSPQTWDIVVGQLAAGQHELFVVAEDMSGATTEESSTFTVVGDSGGGRDGGATPQQAHECSLPKILLNDPNGGELLQAGQEFTVLWGASGCDGANVNIDLSTNSGLSYDTDIVSGVQASSGYYKWTVPSDVDSLYARITVQLMDSSEVVASDASEADFCIGNPEPELDIEECTEDEWHCSDWGECEDGERTRTCQLALDCPGVESEAPVESEICVVLPVCIEDDWNCGAWGECEPTQIQQRICELVVECEGADEVKPDEWRACELPLAEPEPEPVEAVPTNEQDAFVEPDVVEPGGETEDNSFRTGVSNQIEPEHQPQVGEEDGNDDGGADTIHDKLMRNQVLTPEEALAGMRDFGPQVNFDLQAMSDQAKLRYAEVYLQNHECEALGIIVKEDCVEHLREQNDGVFPGCETLSPEDCEHLQRVSLAGYLTRDAIEGVDEAVNEMARTGNIMEIPGVTAISEGYADKSNVMMLQSIQSDEAKTSPFVMFIAPSAEQKLDNWAPPEQIGQPRAGGKVEGAFSARAVLQGEDAPGGLNFSGYCEPDNVCYLFLYSYVPVVTAISTDENGEYVADLGDAVADGRHLAQVVTTDQEGNVVKKSEPDPFFVREGRAVDEKVYLGEGLYEGVSDDIIPFDAFLNNLRQYALLLVLMFVFIVGLGWTSVARRRGRAK